MSYVVELQGMEVQYIRVYKAGIFLSKTNLRRSRCADCTELLESGHGVYRRAYRANGFLCQDCLEKFLRISNSVAGGDGDAGFRFNPDLHWFVACTLGPRQFTTAEVIQAISRRPS